MMEEVGNGKLFDQIDNILDFENDDVEDGLFGSGEVDIDSFPPVWLEESPVVYSAGRGCDTSDLIKANRTSRYEDMVQLEWLSHFFKDSLSKSKLLPICHAKRARSKRPRPASFNPRFYIQLIPPKKRLEQPKKKPKIQFQSHNNNKDPNPNPLRKCTHCEITKTPQWREGPSGPRTLCNACGVRYKKGLLFPEYRPAASPTFVPSLHSNLNRKVIQMRKSKNVDEIVQPELFLDSNSHLEGPVLKECPSLHSNSPRKVTEMRKSMNENEIVQPELLRDSNSHEEGLELVECPISVITTDASSFLPELLLDITKSDVGPLQN